MIWGRTGCVTVCQTGISILVYLKPYTRTIIATVVAYYSSWYTVRDWLWNVYPCFKRFNIWCDRLIYLIFTKVFNLDTASVMVKKFVSASWVIAQCRFTHSCKIISSYKIIFDPPGLGDIFIRGNLTCRTHITVHCNGINESLKIVGVSGSIITADSEWVSEIGSLRKNYRGITSCFLYAVDVKVNRVTVFCIVFQNYSIMVYATTSYISLWLFEVGNPLRATVILATNSEPTIVDSLNVDIRGGILAVVTDNYTGSRRTDMSTSGKFKFDSYRSIDFIRHLIVSIFLEVALIFRHSGGGNNSTAGYRLSSGCISRKGCWRHHKNEHHAD